MKPARLLTPEPVSPKLQAASRALDESIRRGDPTIESVQRTAWVEHLVRLYQIDPQLSRASLGEQLHRDTKGYLPALGHSVRMRLEALGLVERRVL